MIRRMVLQVRCQVTTSTPRHSAPPLRASSRPRHGPAANGRPRRRPDEPLPIRAWCPGANGTNWERCQRYCSLMLISWVLCFNSDFMDLNGDFMELSVGFMKISWNIANLGVVKKVEILWDKSCSYLVSHGNEVDLSRIWPKKTGLCHCLSHGRG